MVKYALARLYFRSEGHVDLNATDPSIVEWFLAEIKRIAPDCKVKNRGEHRVEVGNLHNREQWVGWKMLQQLCENGWEPFEVEGWDSFYLRLKQE